MSKRFLGVDFGKGTDKSAGSVVEQQTDGSVCFEKVYRIFRELSAEEKQALELVASVDSCNGFEISPTLKVSCKYGDACTSPSRRDQTKRKAWLCGSDFSHENRKSGCVAYCRFERFLQSGNRRVPK